ncbi:MAG: hypothetical protein NTU62_19315, partial [Spirochaetes bacterium]|nr:hypothetical protein [Spirochaetota bacterium]
GGTSETMWYNTMPSWMTWMTGAPEVGIVGGLLVRDGDIVAGESSFFFVYKQSDGASLEIREEDGRLILSGKTISIASADIEGCWEWLDQASSNDLRSLRFLMLPEDLDESRLSTLRKLAAANPGLSLGIGSISNSMSAAALFKPRMLILGSSASAEELGGFLAGQNQIETLYIFATDAENLDFLATLPHLRRLAIIDGWDPAKTGPLPKGMRALKSLLLSDSEILDASALAAVPEEIEELSLVGCERITSLSGLEGSPEIKDLSVLGGMKKLVWVGLPPGIAQEQFSAFIGEHPAMKIVELIECKEITDLSPLQRLTGLTGLIVGQYSGTFDAVDQVDQLKSLEFLGLPTEVFDNDPERLAQIRTALPRALVVPAMCLGSGWILLVMPLAALMWITRSWARRRRRTSP